MTRFFWSEFAILLAAALLGGLAIIPYSVRLLTLSQRRPLKFPLPTLLLLSFFQTAVLSALAIGVGLSAAHAIGLGAPYIEAGLAGTGSKQAVVQILLPAIGFGVLGGAVLLLLDLFFLRYWPPELVDFAQRTTLWENLLASFYRRNLHASIWIFGACLAPFKDLAYTGRAAHRCSSLDRERNHGGPVLARTLACYKKSTGLDSATHVDPGAPAQYSDRACLRLAVLDVRYRSGRFSALFRGYRVSRCGNHRVAIEAQGETVVRFGRDALSSSTTPKSAPGASAAR